MPRPDKDSPSPFPDTRWTLVHTVQKGDEAAAARAMEELCRQYWYPIYAFARRGGFGAEDAEDVTQMFFQRLVTGETIQAAREVKGKLRSFMLSLLKKVISNHLRASNATKRGGPERTVSFDEIAAEERYAGEPVDIRDPDSLFDRAWAHEVLAAAEARLREDFATADNLDAYEALREFLPLGDNATPYAAVAKRLGVAEATLRLQIHRMRKRYGRWIEKEIARTASDESEVKTELAHLMTIIGGRVQ